MSSDHEFVQLNRKRLRHEFSAMVLNLMVVHQVTVDELATRMGKSKLWVEGLLDGTPLTTLDDISTVFLAFDLAAHLRLEAIQTAEETEEAAK